MYAGSLFTLAEFPAGVLFVKRMDMTKVVPIVAEVNIRFKRPAMTDIYAHFEFEDSLFAELEAEALEKGKASFNHEQTLTDENGDVVAVTSARYVILKAS
jgi:acyl-CoA thioesterase FadM